MMSREEILAKLNLCDIKIAQLEHELNNALAAKHMLNQLLQERSQRENY